MTSSARSIAANQTKLQNEAYVAICNIRSLGPLDSSYNPPINNQLQTLIHRGKRSPKRLIVAFCNTAKIFCGCQIFSNCFICRELAICYKKLARIVLVSGDTQKQKDGISIATLAMIHLLIKRLDVSAEF